MTDVHLLTPEGWSVHALMNPTNPKYSIDPNKVTCTTCRTYIYAAPEVRRSWDGGGAE